MGKDQTVKQKQRKQLHHNPLGDEIEADKVAKPLKNRVKLKKAARQDNDKNEEFIPKNISTKLMKEIRTQQEEMDQAESTMRISRRERAEDKAATLQVAAEDDDEDDEDAYIGADVEGDMQDLEIDPADEQALQQFMFNKPQETQDLATIIMQKIREKEQMAAAQSAATPEEAVKARLSPKVAEVYSQIASLLHKYTSGSLPKAFKIVPTLSNWEEILYLTRPEKWSAPAMRMATKIFTSNLNVAMATKFFHMILFPRIRDDIQEHKKLNFHLYQALKKATFKSQAFYRGILIPLCESGNCTLKEAIIVGSVLKKCTIPQEQSSVVLMKLAQMPYSGANSIFVRILIDKKYALPYPVVNALVEHFCGFVNEQRRLPVLWHQSLLSFAQRYKTEISADQKEKLKLLLRRQPSAMTEEIRRELFATKSRDADNDVAMGDDVDMAD